MLPPGSVSTVSAPHVEIYRLGRQAGCARDGKMEPDLLMPVSGHRLLVEQ